MEKLLLPLFIIASISASAQESGIIFGKVSDNDMPVPGATIQLQQATSGAVADSEGNFELDGLPPGRHVLTIRSIGYNQVKKEITLNEGERKELHVQLQENSLGLDEVVVTGTMSPTFVKASPVKVEVVTSRYMNTFIPAAASSIVEGIKLVNGIQEVVACGVCFTNSISINGLPGPYTAILMDGTPIYGNLASVYGLNGIPSMIIDRFEVIKGPSSTLYGSEAVAGVINIITKDPESQPALSIDIMGTSHRESFGNISVAPRIGKSSGFVGVNYAYINGFDDRNDDGFGDRINLDRYSLFTKWNIHRESGKKFSLAAKLFYEDRRNGVQAYVKNRNYLDIRGSEEVYGESIFTKRGELFGTYELPLSENLRVDYSLSQHYQDSYYGADHYVAEQSIGFANFIWDKSLDRHNLLVGFTSRYQFYDDNTVATSDSTASGIIDQPDKQFIPGIFLQDEWTVSRSFTVLSGARIDHYNAHGYIFSPRLNLKYKSGDWTTFRANFGTGFRIVNLFTEDHAFITGQRKVEIEGELEPERSYNAALNFNHVYTLGSSQGSIDIDGYYTYFTNKIIPDYDDPTKIVYANTDGRAITKGIGININHQFSFPLSINAGINFQDVSQTERNEAGHFETTRVEFAPEWSSILTVSYEWKSLNTTIAYTARFTGPMALPEVYDLDENGAPVAMSRPTISNTFAFHNVQVSKTFSRKFSAYAGVQNIFDYVQPISPLVGYNDPNASTGFSDFFDTAYAFSPIHGREFYLGVRWDLMKK